MWEGPQEQRQDPHWLADPCRTGADLDVAVEEDIGVGAAHELEHLDPEHGLWSLTIPQHLQGRCTSWYRATAEKRKPSSSNNSH